VATTTPRIGLTKPDGTDLVDIAVLNTNFDKIDSNIASTKIQSTKPTTANAGDLWWDSDTGTLYLYYTDANSSQWVAATSDPINIGVVANQTERDAQYPTPAQGMRVYRTDLGITQIYYGLYNSSTNIGGRTAAGWYNAEKNVGLIPMRPTVVNPIGGGTAAVNALGEVSYDACTGIILNGVFNSGFRNYVVKIRNHYSSGAPTVNLRFSTDGVVSSAGYFGSGSEFKYNIAPTLFNQQFSSSSLELTRADNGYNAGSFYTSMEVGTPYTVNATSVIATTISTNGGFLTSLITGEAGTASRDGFYISLSTGTCSGVISVYGLAN
jgi:hypothetical protein